MIGAAEPASAQRSNAPRPMARISPSRAALFWRSVECGAPDECWPWKGDRNPRGYGRVKVSGKHYFAQRIAFALTNGEVPPGLLVCHSCDNPPCCNPGHLWAGTNADNHQDKLAKGRANLPFGEDGPSAKLTTAEVIEVRRLYSQRVRQRLIAERFKIAVPTVAHIVGRLTWAHLPVESWERQPESRPRMKRALNAQREIDRRAGR